MDSATFAERRRALREHGPDGAILLAGNQAASRNYADNVYPFRQDSSFLYYTGLDRPGLALVLLADGRERLYGPAGHPDDIVWSGPQPSLGDLGERAGVEAASPIDDLADDLADLRGSGKAVHFLPPYRDDRRMSLGAWLGQDPRRVDAAASDPLIQVVVAQRSVKSRAEVAEVEEALEVTASMLGSAFTVIAPERSEAEVAGALHGVALARDRQQAFKPIVSVRGEVLHNESYDNVFAEGDLLVMDCGAESARGYAADITRTVPVSGRFTAEQRDVYQVVLAAQLAAIAAVSPGRSNLDVHLVAARTIAQGMIDMGLMQGDAEAAVQTGAHALFFPHGIGHMLGLDAHDMEDLGDVVGYAPGQRRSDQFGLNALRLARQLEPGFVITIEPGVYFIPALIDRWSGEGRHHDLIRYDRVERLRGLGGIRIEDDVLVTPEGHRVLGIPIPKSVEDVETALRSGG